MTIAKRIPSARKLYSRYREQLAVRLHLPLPSENLSIGSALSLHRKVLSSNVGTFLCAKPKPLQISRLADESVSIRLP